MYQATESDCNLSWIDEKNFLLNGYHFELGTKPKDPDKVLIIKSKDLLSNYINLRSDYKGGNIVELGIKHGGSTIFLNEYLEPKKMLSLDIEDSTSDSFKGYVANMQPKLRVDFGIDQSDTETVTSIVKDHFNSEVIDIVIDDASHFYKESKASFNCLFPMLRPGGLYIIEDWGWAHWGGMWQTEKAPWKNRKSLANLLFEITMTSASLRNGLIDSIYIRYNVAIVRRGENVIADDFDISGSYFARNKELVLL